MSMNQYQLVVKKGPNPGQAYPIFADRINIGRDPMSDIIFKDPEVSRKHLILTKSGLNYVLQDLGSTNGTFVDGQRLKGDSVVLHGGQEIALGGAITLIYKVDEEVENILGENIVPTAEKSTPEFLSSEEVIDHWAKQPVAATGPLQETADEEDDDEYDDEYGDEYEDDEEANAPSIDQLQPMQRLAPTPAKPHPPLARRAASPPPPTVYSTEPLSAPVEKNERGKIVGIAIGVFIGLTFFCCAFVVFMYYFGGDWLLNQINTMP